MENIRIHGNDKRPAKEKQKLRAAKIVYKDGIKPEGHTYTHTTHKKQQNANKTHHKTHNKTPQQNPTCEITTNRITLNQKQTNHNEPNQERKSISGRFIVKN